MALTQASEGGLKISNAGTNGQFLQKSSNTGGLTWATVSTTPEGTAILSTGESGGSKYLREDGDGSCSWQSVPAGVGGATGVDFNDDVYIRLGTGNDLKIWHNAGANSYIRNESGNLLIESNGSGADAIEVVAGGEVNLFHNGTKKLETTSDGTKVTGNLTVTTGNSILTNSSQGQLTIKGGATYPGGAIKFAGGQSGATDQGTIIFYAGTDTSLETRFRIQADGRVQIPNDTGKYECGSSGDLQIYHDGTDSHIDFKSGQLNIRPENTAGSYEDGIIVKQNDAVELYYNDSKRLSTTSTGIQVENSTATGITVVSANDADGGIYFNDGANQGAVIYQHDGNYMDFRVNGSEKVRIESSGSMLFLDGAKVHFGGANNVGGDLQIWHDGTGNNSYIANGTGNLVLSNSNVDTKSISLYGDAGLTEELAHFIQGGAVQLFHNDVKTFETKSGGITVIGDIGFANSGSGIDFGANSHASGMSSEKFDDYEEGTWTPDFYYHTSVSNVAGHYTKIGRMVYAYFTGNYWSAASDQQYISNLPFTSSNNSGGNGGVARGYQNFDIENGPIYYVELNATKLYFYKNNGVAFPASNGDGKSFRGVAIYHTDS